MTHVTMAGTDSRTNDQQHGGSSCDESRYHTYRIHNEIENQDLSDKTLTTKASLTLRSTVQLTDM
jgi:hypothetical protein